MGSLRARLHALAAVWVAFQLAGLMGGPLAIELAAASASEVCTCPGGDHQTCPMHHGQPGGSETGRPSRCMLQNPCAPLDAALLPLAGGLGVLPAATLDTPQHGAEAVSIQPIHVQSRRALPDAPPPRA